MNGCWDGNRRNAVSKKTPGYDMVSAAHPEMTMMYVLRWYSSSSSTWAHYSLESPPAFGFGPVKLLWFGGIVTTVAWDADLKATCDNQPLLGHNKKHHWTTRCSTPWHNLYTYNITTTTHTEGLPQRRPWHHTHRYPLTTCLRRRCLSDLRTLQIRQHSNLSSSRNSSLFEVSAI